MELQKNFKYSKVFLIAILFFLVFGCTQQTQTNSPITPDEQDPQDISNQDNTNQVLDKIEEKIEQELEQGEKLNTQQESNNPLDKIERAIEEALSTQ